MSIEDHSLNSQEIRYAVVMYGGVSLAIYMNGIAQEMLRLVRSTSLDNPALLSGTEKIYREIACLLHPGRRPGDTDTTETPRTHFVIDLLSGTSAGGINAIFLAKALSCKSKNLEDLRSLWIKEADIDTLLNDGKSDDDGRYPLANPKKSLFNSLRMYGLLRNAFDRMDEPDRVDNDMRDTADRIDLYVTATDLNGLVVPIELTDKPILERNHRSVFHFEYDPQEQLNDFEKDSNPMLAFAARCTSSFPGAFEPMRYQDIQPKPMPEEINQHQHFFETYRAPGEEEKSPLPELDFRQRVYADGGYLDNRPFGYVIDQIGERTSNCLVSRKLVFVDPFPEHLENRPVRTDFNFIDNSVLAITELPRYETIRQDLARINNTNRLAVSLANIENKLFSIDPSGVNLVPGKMKLGTKYQDLFLDQMLEDQSELGPLFVADQMLKVSSISNWLALVVTRQLGFNESGDYYRVVRLIIHAWRSSLFSATSSGAKDPKKDSETKFIFSYDLLFRISRLRYLLYMVDRISTYTEHEFKVFRKHLASAKLIEESGLPEFSRKDFLKALAPFRKRETELLLSLHRAKKRIEAHDRNPLSSEEMKPLKEQIESLRSRFANMNLLSLLTLTDSEQQQNHANRLYNDAAEGINKYFLSLKDIIQLSLDKVHAERTRLREAELTQNPVNSLAAGWLGKLWDTYEIVGSVMARILPHGQIGESGVVDLFRIGPADTDLTIHRANEKEQKLAGARFHSFGAFLSEGWRENDILWGRLDGAERLIVSLLPDEREKNLRESYIRRIRETILREEFDPANGRIYRWFASQINEICGPGLNEQKLVECIKETSSEPLECILKALHEHPVRWQSFLSAYYDIPSGPTRRQKAEWLSRSIRIAGEMIEGLGPVKGFGCKVKLAGWLLIEIVQVSLPGSLRNLWFSHVLCLLMLTGVILIVLGALFTSNFAAVGLKLLLYAGSLWIILRCMRSWLSRGRFLRWILASLGAFVLLLATLGYGVLLCYIREAYNQLIKWFQ